ncbi:MAG: glutathione S-transferase C-terminal domain-containing protein, partial [Pseudomonadota bacterium]
NDILVYLEQKYPEPALIPSGKDEETRALLADEDDLHLDLRAISMRYLFGPQAVRTEEQLSVYENTGAGTIGGEPDPHKAVELKFFREMAANNGVSDDQIVKSVGRFRNTLDTFDQRLAAHEHLLDDHLSVVDIAWYIYAVRLTHAGYPLHRLHKNLGAWFDKLNAKPEFQREVQLPPPLVAARDALHAEQKSQGTSLEAVAGL